MDRFKEEKNPIIPMIVVFLKIFIFYSLLLGFSEKTYYIEMINSFSDFLCVYFFSKATLTIMALCVATCIICIITLIPASLICFIIEKYIKRELKPEYPFYIAVITSCLFITYNFQIFIHIELFLCFLVFLPFEKVRLGVYIKRYKGILIIWSIAAVMSAFIFSVFRNLDGNNDVNKMQCSVVISKVYVCTSKGAKVYHRYRDCKGLNRCGRQIKAVSLEQAKRMGRRECKMCY